ncbi:MAG: hypothetical protein ACTIJ6_00430 [Leucobacter sp.]
MATAKDRSVYVRRRIIVLLALIAVIAAVVLIIVRPGSSGGAKNVETVEVPTDLVDQPETEETEAPETPACEASQLEVIPVLSQPSYGVGENPELSLSVTNSGNDACIADLGTAGMSFTIASGSDEVWRSTDCQKAPESLAVILDPEETLESESISWDRTRSSKETCDISRDAVVAGGASYHLGVMAGGVDSTETAQFLLY